MAPPGCHAMPRRWPSLRRNTVERLNMEFKKESGNGDIHSGICPTLKLGGALSTH
jgi:hypothetical protein